MSGNSTSPEPILHDIDPSLPRQATSFVGRARDIQTISSMLAREDLRLLTLLGPGGIGKTRLAIEVASRLEHQPGLIVRFISLENVTDHTLLEGLISRSFGVKPSRGRRPFSYFGLMFAGMRILLVLDNIEHLPDASLTVSRLLVTTEHVKVMATSRAPLDIRGEHLYPLAPLDISPADQRAPLRTLAQTESIHLFLDRARMIDPGFALSETNAPAIAAICRNLDGLPLAIELAAAQTAVLPPRLLVEHIDTFRPLPVPGPRDVPARLQTLQNAISWSHDLLSERARILFRRLSVFTGSFGFDAAERLNKEIAASGSQVDDVGSGITAALGELIGNSLVYRDDWRGDARYAMLRTIRLFARGRLDEAGESVAAQAAHARIYRDIAVQMQWAWLIASDDELLRLEIDHPNMITALTWFHETGDAIDLGQMTAALTGFWYARSHEQVGFTWITRVMNDAPDLPLPLRGRLYLSAGMLLRDEADVSTARQWLSSGMAMLDQSDEPAIMVLGLIWSGAIAYWLQEHHLADELLERALHLADRIKPPSLRAALMARALSNLGENAVRRGEYALATERHNAALDIYTAYGPLPGLARALGDSGDAACLQGDFASGMAWFRECLTHPSARSDRRLLAAILEWCALVALEWHRPLTGARLLGASESILDPHADAVGQRMASAVRARVVSLLEHVRREAAMSRARSEGREMTIDQAIAEIQDLLPPASSNSAESIDAVALTGREKDVIRLLVAGSTNREIARELSLSTRTIEAHVSHVYRKLGVQTRTAAVATAIAKGLAVPADEAAHEAARPPDPQTPT